MTEEHAQAAHAAGAIGIPWQTVLAWLLQYGAPLVLQVLQTIGANGGKGITVQQWIEWAITALAALRAKQPLPPVPTGAAA